MCGGLKKLSLQETEPCNWNAMPPNIKYQRTARCPHKIPLPLSWQFPSNRSDGTSNFSILGLRMRSICGFHHPAIGVPPMSLLCTGGPGRRGRRGLDPAESCDFFLDLRTADSRSSFSNCVHKPTMFGSNDFDPLQLHVWTVWFLPNLGFPRLGWTNDETDGTPHVVPWKSSDVFFSKMHEWWTLIWKEEDDLAEDPIVDLADPHFDVEVRRWWFLWALLLERMRWRLGHLYAFGMPDGTWYILGTVSTF